MGGRGKAVKGSDGGNSREGGGGPRTKINYFKKQRGVTWSKSDEGEYKDSQDRLRHQA